MIGGKEWAYRLAQRELIPGVVLSLAQRQMWRDALGVDRQLPVAEALRRADAQPEEGAQ